jgi:uncharacterized RDD family membrane protein YckC
MNASERYIQEVLQRVLGTEADRRRLAEDLRAHFQDGQTRGDTAAQIIARLGSPDDVAEAFHLEREMAFAGFWRRVGAFTVDLGVLTLLSAPLFLCALWLLPRVGPMGGARLVAFGAAVSLALGLLGIWVCYFPLLEARFGKTLGKHLLGLRVVRQTGTPISLGQAFLRRLSLYFELLLPDALFILFTANKQRALDMLAKTVVVLEPGRRVSFLAWLASGGLVLLALGAMTALVGLVDRGL